VARIDPLIDLLMKEPGSELVMETGSAAMLKSASGSRPLIRQQLTTPQIVSACAEVVPPESRDDFPGDFDSEFRYAGPYGAVRLRFEPLGDRVKATFRADLAAPSRARGVLVPPAPAQYMPAVQSYSNGGGASLNGDGASANGGGGFPRGESLGPIVTAPIHTGPAVEAAADKKRIESGPPPMDAAEAMDELLQIMVVHNASDLHLQSDYPPAYRVDGDMVVLEGYDSVSPDRLEELLFSIAPPKNRLQWQETRDTDFAHETDKARFRVNLFADRKGIGAVLRQIPNQIKTAAELGVPKAVLDLCGLPKGLVLVTGPTGSGKSTTLASLIDHINRTRDDHIITIEDPIEFVHANQRCLVNQREIGVHTSGFKQALRAALREDPDVVLVGEMRDLETISIAIETAETGHLVFGTLHTNTAPSTIDRVIDQFPSDRQQQIRTMLSESLKAVVTQVLCKKIGGGRVAAQEILLVNGAISNLIREGKTFQVPSVMQTSRGSGMVTMNDALLELVKKREVAPKDALAKSQNKTELKASIERAGFTIEA